jgi:hypothetical protein
MVTKHIKAITFAITVLATLQFERTAYQGGSFAFIGFYRNNSTPPMLVLTIQNVHLGGFSFKSLFEI